MPTLLTVSHGHAAPCHTANDPCPTPPNFRSCTQYYGSGGCNCQHDYSASASAAAKTELRDKVVADIREIMDAQADQVVHISHLHPAPDCDENPVRCDSRTRIACHPALQPAQRSFLCIHQITSSELDTLVLIVESIINAP